MVEVCPSPAPCRRTQLMLQMHSSVAAADCPAEDANATASCSIFLRRIPAYRQVSRSLQTLAVPPAGHFMEAGLVANSQPARPSLSFDTSTRLGYDDSASKFARAPCPGDQHLRATSEILSRWPRHPSFSPFKFCCSQSSLTLAFSLRYRRAIVADCHSLLDAPL